MIAFFYFAIKCTMLLFGRFRYYLQYNFLPSDSSLNKLFIKCEQLQKKSNCAAKRHRLYIPRGRVHGSHDFSRIRDTRRSSYSVSTRLQFPPEKYHYNDVKPCFYLKLFKFRLNFKIKTSVQGSRDFWRLGFFFKHYFKTWYRRGKPNLLNIPIQHPKKSLIYNTLVHSYILHSKNLLLFEVWNNIGKVLDIYSIKIKTCSWNK